MSRAAVLTLLALPSGYLLCWFIWGAPLWGMLLLLFGGAALWTLVPRRGLDDAEPQGGWTFSRSLLSAALLGLSAWVMGALWTGAVLVSSPDNPLPLDWPQLLPLLLAGAGVVAASLAGVARVAGRAGREGGRPVLAPWLWLAGVLAFALFPAVTVDCRNIDLDPSVPDRLREMAFRTQKGMEKGGKRGCDPSQCRPLAC